MMYEYNLQRLAGALIPSAKASLLIVLLFMGVQTASAQGFRVQGVVLSSVDDSPMPGVNIVEVGTTNGAITDSDGAFALDVAGPNATLAVSFVGFVTQTVAVNGRSNLVVTLQEDVEALEEVVVTAFGIERKTKALGYSVSAVGGEELVEARETNVANALAGKVAGVVVSKPATGVGGSSRVVIRGATSLGGDNQPLYVVDGVPIDNSNLGSAGMWGGVDQGDGVSSVNPDDIEEISVLKGPSAAALYGSRAANGVILITTKQGRAGQGLGVEFNTNTVFEDALVGYSNYQTRYGQGSQGEAPTTQAEAFNNSSSWGAPLDGSNVIQFDGVARPYVAVPDKVSQFYQTGLTTTNTLALSRGFQNTSFRFSATHLNNGGIVPNSSMERLSLTLRGTGEFGRLTADVKANYVREDVNNRTRLSDSPGNPNHTLALLPVNVDPQTLKPGHEPDNELKEYQYSNNIWNTNSYWAAERFIHSDVEDRIIGFAQLRYRLTDWLSVQGRTGQDWYTTRSTSSEPYGTAYKPGGSLSERETRILERNTDFLFMADNLQVTPDVGISATFGGNRMYRNYEQLSLNGQTFNIPGLVTISNMANISTGLGISEKAINSLYGSAEVSFRDYLFLTATARNDWSSTLHPDHNSYFYPSLSASFVFSDAFQMPSWLSFGKLRASWAEVGGDTDPYKLIPTYGLMTFSHLGQPLGYIGTNEIPLWNLKPSATVGREAGFDIRFLNNRFGIDFTWYDQVTSDQILSTTVPVSTGYGSKVINAGEMRNRGIELLLSTTPVQTQSLRWDLGLNFAKNDNEVVELYGDMTTFTLGAARDQTAWIAAVVGEPYGTIRGYAYERDAEGNIVMDAAGLPVRGPLTVLGNGTPDWRSGLTNTVRYKNFTLSSLIDISWGGEIYSNTNARAYGYGLHENTLVGRDVCEQVGYDANDESGCWVAPGVDQDGNPNAVATFPQNYYGAVASRIAEEFIYDASYIKLRELRFGYRLPASLISRTPIRLATVTLVARNLWLIYSNVDNVDPESNYNNTNAQGLEMAGVPQTRSIGLNISFRL